MSCSFSATRRGRSAAPGCPAYREGPLLGRRSSRHPIWLVEEAVDGRHKVFVDALPLVPPPLRVTLLAPLAERHAVTKLARVERHRMVRLRRATVHSRHRERHLE